MYTSRPSVVIINGINALGLEIAKRFSTSSSVVVVGKTGDASHLEFPKHVSLVDSDLFSTIKLSKIKDIIILNHEKVEDLVSAADLVNQAKFLSEIFHIATANQARIVLTTSYNASRQHLFAKYNDKDQPYDFPSMQSFIEKLTLEQARKTPSFILRLGDVYGIGMPKDGVIYRMIKDVVSGNFVRVDDDGLEKLFPVSQEDIARIILKTLKTDIKGGIFTVAPREGITQMSFANMCMQYSTNVSYIKFVKSRAKAFSSDPMYENMYTPAPYISNDLNASNVENDLLLLVKTINPQRIESLRKEKTTEPKLPKQKKVVKLIPQSIFVKYAVSGFLIVTFLILFVIPFCFTLANTILLSDGNKIFVSNNNKFNTSELAEDARFNKAKSADLLGSMNLIQWILPLTGDDFKSNKNYLLAQEDFFDALSYSKDYSFTSIPEVSRSLVQLKLQSAKSYIQTVQKEKLFGALANDFDNVKNIILNASL